jgi:uncharacterized membrane protein YphA (DoxX/SURF4 family)
LRLAAGGTAVIDGAAYCSGPDALGRWSTLVGVAAVIAGAATIAGVLTPASGAVLAGFDLCRVLSVVPLAAWSFLDGRPEIVLRAAVTIALVMLGPGAQSIDAYLFGRREIVFPGDH